MEKFLNTKIKNPVTGREVKVSSMIDDKENPLYKKLNLKKLKLKVVLRKLILKRGVIHQRDLVVVIVIAVVVVVIAIMVLMT